MLGDTVHRHARMPPDERLVRFLVVLPERAELVRHKLERSRCPTELQDGDWHLIKANHLRDWVSHERWRWPTWRACSGSTRGRADGRPAGAVRRLTRSRRTVRAG